jgi:hypothetical protein
METGVKRPCILNSLSNWHVTKNFAGDLMHDFLEGVGQYEVKSVLYQLIMVEKLFSLAKLNSRIAFFGYGCTDKKARPTAISKLGNLLDRNLSLKQRAMQFYCLFRLLPLMIGDLVPAGNAYWELYLELREIADLLFAQRWTVAMIESYKTLYADHLLHFKQLFPTFSLIPKHHFLLHYGTFAANNGPPCKIMVSSEEMKGNFFKRQSHIMCNFRNVPLSLAQKHQMFAYMSTQSYRVANTAVEILKTLEMPLESLLCSQILVSDFNICDKECVIAPSFIVCGQSYTADNMLPLKFDEYGNVVFGRLLGAIISGYEYDHSSIVLLFDQCTTVEYVAHLHCYTVLMRDTVHCAVRIADLLDYHPLDRYATDADDLYHVCLRYAIL